MSPETIFSVSLKLVLPGWLLLIFVPRWKWTARFITAVLIPLVLGIAYALIVVTHFGQSEGDFNSLAGVALLFRNPYNLLAGWLHYFAFDLFIGSWQVRDAQRVGIHHLLVVPCLVLTLFFGPIGLLVFLVLRAAKRKFFVDEIVEQA